MDSLLSFPVGLFHPLQHAGLSRRSPGGRSFVVFEGAEGLTFLSGQRTSIDRVNLDQTTLEFRVEGKTAPRPVLRVGNQAALQRIHVHVLELFDFLLQTPHVEIIEAALPKARQRIVATCKGQMQLSGGLALFAAQTARDALFENLHGHGRSATTGLADQQVNVFGHHDVTHQREAKAIAHLAKNIHKSISGANRAQQRQASIASESNEMQMSTTVAPDELVGHGTEEKSKPRPFKPERVGHPEKLNQSPGVDVLEWYHPQVRACQHKKRERVGHPPGKAKPITRR
jgi:hypothetical protein